MEYSIGTKVVHPAYGAGQVIAIKEHQFAEQLKQYYVIQIPLSRLQVMVPVDRAESVGLRDISDDAVLDKVWDVLQSEPKALSQDWKERKEGIRVNIKSRDLITVARDIRDLAARRQERRLSYTDSKLLEESEKLVASELALAHDLEMDEALKRVRSFLQFATDTP